MIHPLQPVHLLNTKVRLTLLRPDDREALYQVASDPLIWEQHPNPDRYQRPVFDTYFNGALESGGAFLITDAATGSRAIVDHHGLPHALGEIDADQARDDVGAAAGRERHDQADGFGGVGLRMGDAHAQQHSDKTRFKNAIQLNSSTGANKR